MTTLLLVMDTERRLAVWDRLVRKATSAARVARTRGGDVLAGGIDLVVLDLDLPDGDGFGVCETLRQRFRWD
jgi:DNA-binding response OmpR family regulator